MNEHPSLVLVQDEGRAAPGLRSLRTRRALVLLAVGIWAGSVLLFWQGADLLAALLAVVVLLAIPLLGWLLQGAADVEDRALDERLVAVRYHAFRTS